MPYREKPLYDGYDGVSLADSDLPFCSSSWCSRFLFLSGFFSPPFRAISAILVEICSIAVVFRFFGEIFSPLAGTEACFLDVP